MPRKKNQKELPHSERLLSLAQSARDANPQAKSKPAKSGLSIKGASGPFIVVGSNFSPGTSAADIQAALEARTGPMLSCRVISNSPAVTAEIAYVEKEIAENTVANFDNQWVRIAEQILIDFVTLLTFYTIGRRAAISLQAKCWRRHHACQHAKLVQQPS